MLDRGGDEGGRDLLRLLAGLKDRDRAGCDSSGKHDKSGQGGESLLQRGHRGSSCGVAVRRFRNDDEERHG